MRFRPWIVSVVSLCACARQNGPQNIPTPVTRAEPISSAPPAAPSSAMEPVAPVTTAVVALSTRVYALPGAVGPVTLDYLLCDRAHGRVFLPVGDTASVDVFDVAKKTFARVDGFKNAEREVRGKRRMMGPSAVTRGDGFVYVGDRATSQVCAVEENALRLGACLTLPTATDGVSYVASMKEVWVTTPRDHSLTVLDASKPAALKPKTVVKTDGEPEGYATDPGRGIFYTNLEDKNRTLGVDIATHTVKTNWAAGCNDSGPRGIAVDEAHNFVFVACTDGVRVLDGSHDGALLGNAETGAGVDNLEYIEATRLLYVAAAKAARVTVLRVTDSGGLTVVATGATAEGARNAVVDGDGNIYVVDPNAARLLVLSVGTASKF